MNTTPQKFPEGTRARAAQDRAERTIGYRIRRTHGVRHSEMGDGDTDPHEYVKDWFTGWASRDAGADPTFGEWHPERYHEDAAGRAYALADLHRLRAFVVHEGEDAATFKLVRVLRVPVDLIRKRERERVMHEISVHCVGERTIERSEVIKIIRGMGDKPDA